MDKERECQARYRYTAWRKTVPNKTASCFARQAIANRKERLARFPMVQPSRPGRKERSNRDERMARQGRGTLSESNRQRERGKEVFTTKTGNEVMMVQTTPAN